MTNNRCRRILLAAVSIALTAAGPSGQTPNVDGNWEITLRPLKEAKPTSEARAHVEFQLKGEQLSAIDPASRASVGAGKVMPPGAVHVTLKADAFSIHGDLKSVDWGVISSGAEVTFTGTVHEGETVEGDTVIGGVPFKWVAKRVTFLWACTGHSPPHIASSDAEMKESTQKYGCSKWHVIEQ